MRILPLIFFLILTTLCAADNPFLGTWTLNVAKSTSGSLPLDLLSITWKLEADGKMIKRTVTAVDRQGKSTIIIENVPWDGQDHPVQLVANGPTATTAVTSINDHESKVTINQPGTVTTTILSVVSEDGKTMTNTYDTVTPKGVKRHYILVFDRQ